MPEKLLTISEVCELLGFSEERVRELADKGELPAYKIGGQFLRFRKEQIEAIRRELPAKSPRRKFGAAVKKFSKKIPAATYPEPFANGFADFFYFYDFYIVSGLLILLLLWFIFK